MPWVDKDKCSGCGICVEECPVGVILMGKVVAEKTIEELESLRSQLEENQENYGKS